MVRFRCFKHVLSAMEHRIMTTPMIPMLTCRTVVPRPGFLSVYFFSIDPQVALRAMSALARYLLGKDWP